MGPAKRVAELPSTPEGLTKVSLASPFKKTRRRNKDVVLQPQCEGPWGDPEHTKSGTRGTERSPEEEG